MREREEHVANQRRIGRRNIAENGDADGIQNQIQKCLLVKRGGASAWLLHRDLRDACPVGLASVLHGKRIPKQVILDAISGPSKNRTAAGGTISL